MLRARSLLSICLLASCLAWLAPLHAQARRQRELAYPSEQIWNAALRLIRVDLRFPVTDRDLEGGFILFEFVANGKHHPASLELVAQGSGRRATTVVVVQVQGMPSYVEQLILDKLAKKLLSEYGAPLAPEKPPKSPAPVEPDAGAPAEPPPS